MAENQFGVEQGQYAPNEQNIFSRGWDWLSSKIPSGQDVTDMYGENKGQSILQGTKPTPDVGGFDFNLGMMPKLKQFAKNFTGFGGNTLGPEGYQGEVDKSVTDLDEDDAIQQGANNNTPGANNLLDRTMEGDNNYGIERPEFTNEEDEHFDLYGGDPLSNQDTRELRRATRRAPRRVARDMRRADRGGGLFSNLDLGNVGSYSNDPVMNEDTGDFMLDAEGNPLMEENKGKGIFGKEGGFMSKFGTGQGFLSGMSGAFKGGVQGAGSYKQSNPYEYEVY